MKDESLFWKVFNILVVIIMGLGTAYAAYYSANDIWARGPAPEKKVEMSTITFIHPMRDLAQLSDHVSMNIQVGDQSIHNLVIGYSSIRNIGASPIEPKDYTEPLTVRVHKPWKIIAVEDVKSSNIQFHWKRIDDNKFEANPILLNPADSIATYVYVTNTDSLGVEMENKNLEPKIEWNTRIINLQGISPPPPILQTFSKYVKIQWGILIYLGGWSLIFTICGMLLFQAFHIHLMLENNSFKNGEGWKTLCWILGSSLVSLCAAEALSTYMFGSILELVYGGVNHWMNFPPILLLFVFSAYLFHRGRNHKKSMANTGIKTMT